MVRLSANSIRVVDDPESSGGDSMPNDNPATPDHVGVWLREAREAMGRDLRDVAAHLRIRYPYLLAIEEGRFDDLPGRAYATGFIRSYASHVGLDSEKMVERFKADADAITAELNLKFPTPAPEGRFPGGSVLLVSALLAAALIGGWYYYHSRGAVGLDRVPPAPQSSKVELPAAPVRDAPARLTAPVATPPVTTTTLATPTPAPVAQAEPDVAPNTPDAATDDAPIVATITEAAPTPETGSVLTPDAAIDADSPPTVAAAAEPAADAAERNLAAAQSEVDAMPETPAPVAMPSPTAGPTDVPTDAPATATPPAVDPAVTPAPAAETLPASESVAVVEPMEPAPTERDEPPTAMPAGETPDDVATVTAPAPVDATPAVDPAPAAPVAEAPVAGSVTAEPATAEATMNEPVANEPADAAAPTASVAALPSVPAMTPPDAPKGRVYGLSNRDARIVLTARGDSWVQVRDGDQNALLTRMLHAGDSYHVPDRPGLVLSAGNPSVLDVELEGEPAFAIADENVPMSDIALDVDKLRDGTAVR